MTTEFGRSGADAPSGSRPADGAQEVSTADAASIPNAWTPGPWGICGNGNCPCKAVWCADYPIADVTSGVWGDEYPAIRPLDAGGMIGTAVEAYMERMDYGEIPEETARANGRLIASAPSLFFALQYARNLIGPDEVIDAALALAVQGDLESEAKMDALYKSTMNRLASAIEAPSGVETGNTDSTEGESAASEAGDAR